MKRIMSIFLCVVMMLCACACDVVKTGDESETTQIKNDELATTQLTSEITATIKVKGYGDIVLELYPNDAPNTVANFVSLAREGFYDGRIFHRVIKNFMIQGGSSDGLGFEGSGKEIKGEFSANGFENNIKHKRGVISMARTMMSYDSASSQFFIMHETNSDLDGDYAAFGKVISGMEIVDKIAEVATNSDDKPLEDVVIETITVTGGENLVPEYIN